MFYRNPEVVNLEILWLTLSFVYAQIKMLNDIPLFSSIMFYGIFKNNKAYLFVELSYIPINSAYAVESQAEKGPVLPHSRNVCILLFPLCS